MWRNSWVFNLRTSDSPVCPILLLGWRCALLPLGTTQVHTSDGIGGLSNNCKIGLTCSFHLRVFWRPWGFVAFKPGSTMIHMVETLHPCGVKVVSCNWYFLLPSHCVCGSWFCYLFGVLFFLGLTVIFCLARLCFLNNTLSQSGCSTPMAH